MGGKSCLEKNGVQSELRIKEWHITIYGNKLVHADMSFTEMFVVV